MWTWRRWRSERRERRVRLEEERQAYRRRLERDNSDLQRRCAALVGEVLERVFYVEMEHSEPMWNADPDYDSLDFGLDLHMASQQVFGLTWKDTPGTFDFGIDVAPEQVSESIHRQDVTETSRWASLVGRPVTEARVIWRPIEESWNGVAPQTIHLSFGSDRVLVTASEFGTPGTDHVTVFFGDAWERRRDFTADLHESLD